MPTRAYASAASAREVVVARELAHDGDPVPRRRAGGDGPVGPVIGNRLLCIREAQAHVVDFKAGGVEV
jgi:hypothetical protein